MTIFFFFAFMILLSWTLNLAFNAFWYRHKKGKFNVVHDNATNFSFVSDLGSFNIYRKEQYFWMANERMEKIPFSQLQKLVIHSDEERALFTEILFGFHFSDFYREYHDVVQWHTLVIKLKNGRDIPIYKVGQIERRQLWMNWWLRLEKNVLAKLNLFEDAEDTLHSVYDQLGKEFEKSGVTVTDFRQW